MDSSFRWNDELEMLKNIWVFPKIKPAESEIGKQSLGLLAVARGIAEKVGGAVTALLFSDRPLDVAGTLGRHGILRAYVFQDPLFSSFSAPAYAAALLPRLHQEKPWLLLMGNTPAGTELAPHLAALLETGLISDCIKIDFSDIENPGFYRPVYGGQLYQELVFATDKTLLVTMDIKTLNPAPPAAELKTETIVIESDLPADLIKAKHLEYLPADSQTIDVAEADTIVAAGMGAATDALYPLVAELAALVEGAIGTTRPVMDGGKIPRDRLIGQTGKTVSPDFYFALGISGATHHTGGIQASGKIVAVNRDPLAPIFQNADAGAVADLKEVLPRLIAKIKKAKADGEIL